MFNTPVLFRSKEDFIAGLSDGRVKNFTLVEVDGWAIPENVVRTGRKQTVMSFDEEGMNVVDTEGIEGRVSLSGKWSFRNHRLDILDGNTGYTFIVNPLF